MNLSGVFSEVVRRQVKVKFVLVHSQLSTLYAGYPGPAGLGGPGRP